jgi:hypothetical protein
MILSLLIVRRTNSGVDSGGKGLSIARCVDIKQSVRLFGYRRTLCVQ